MKNCLILFLLLLSQLTYAQKAKIDEDGIAEIKKLDSVYLNNPVFSSLSFELISSERYLIIDNYGYNSKPDTIDLVEINKGFYQGGKQIIEGSTMNQIVNIMTTNDIVAFGGAGPGDCFHCSTFFTLNKKAYKRKYLVYFLLDIDKLHVRNPTPTQSKVQ